ncbi:hypothetical protein [Pedobacter chitinilyticus]|uniref:DUF4386 domain-containing protein n=1 Tax=Pedobacter chitinilyticus TaxID=2233776 RepID=A0A3S3PQM5_9SPHI|nr:hypothetical protein [Pedobacter chitinilyticus]RWU10814.1 hypothetical protein DPV69_05650 [Pedobacter chitinilyticus]
MATFSNKLTGISLLLGAAMSVLTVVLHPLGGDMAHLVKIKFVLIFSHTIAIACAPLIGFGLWGLSKLLTDRNRTSILALFIALWGLGAASLAGTLNGLVLPQFATAYVGSDVDATLLDAILDYARYFNKSLAYVFMASIVVSILLWSLLMTYQKGLCKWLGYYGLLVFAIGAAALFSNTDMVSVGLFGVFIFVMASWLIVAGVLLIKQKPTN